MVFYFNYSDFPCPAFEWRENVSEIYDAIATLGNNSNDGNTYTATPCSLIVITKPSEDHPEIKYYTIDRVEFKTTPAGFRIKVTLSAYLPNQ